MTITTRANAIAIAGMMNGHMNWMTMSIAGSGLNDREELTTF